MVLVMEHGLGLPGRVEGAIEVSGSDCGSESCQSACMLFLNQFQLQRNQ